MSRFEESPRAVAAQAQPGSDRLGNAPIGDAPIGKASHGSQVGGNAPSTPQHNRPLAVASNGNPQSNGRFDSTQNPKRLAEAERAARQLARNHYENFIVASILLPRRLHQPFYNVYAFCRTADDVADESASTQIALRELEQLQRELDATFAGKPNHSLFVALAHTIEQFELSQQPFDDLLDAFRQDQGKSRYASEAEVLDYCRRSADPVGRIVLRLVQADDEENRRLSDAICTGLQLVNFLQDVARDYRRGRIYLAEDEMQRFGVEESMFRLSQTPQPLRELLSQQCVVAENWLRRGLPLADRVPRWFSGDVRLFAHGGLETLKAIRAIDFDVLRLRPTVSKRKQFGLVLRAALGLL